MGCMCYGTGRLIKYDLPVHMTLSMEGYKADTLRFQSLHMYSCVMD